MIISNGREAVGFSGEGAAVFSLGEFPRALKSPIKYIHKEGL